MALDGLGNHDDHGSAPSCKCAERVEKLHKLWLFREEMMAKLDFEKISDGHAGPAMIDRQIRRPRTPSLAEWFAIVVMVVVLLGLLVLL